jgi:hypothetical protein
MFDHTEARADSKNDVENYLDVYHSGPLTKSEMLNRIADGRAVDESFMRKFKIKRAGKDKDDIFWNYGKLHGLENLAYATQEEIEAT